MRDATVLHSDLFPEFPCDSELMAMEKTIDREDSSSLVLRLRRCGTEITFTDCGWVTVVYPGMKSGLEV